MYLIRDRLNFRKPMVLLERDGNRPVPTGGVLFYALNGDHSTFVDRGRAEAAIADSVAWSEERGYGWTEDDYEIQDVDDYKAELKDRDRRRAAARKPAHAGADTTKEARG